MKLNQHTCHSTPHLRHALCVPCSEATFNLCRVAHQVALSDLESAWLQGGRSQFMHCGTASDDHHTLAPRSSSCSGSIGSQPSLADLFACEELEQLILLNKAMHGIDRGELLQPHPVIRAWMARVAAACEPHYSQVHAILHKAAAAVAAGIPIPKKSNGRSRL